MHERGQTGTNNSIFGNTGVGGQTFGGGAIVGVASKDKDPTIRIFNKKKTYDEWVFIYSPMMDMAAIRCCAVHSTARSLAKRNRSALPPAR